MALQNVYALLYEYRLLLAMHALGIKLDPGSQARLGGLGHRAALLPGAQGAARRLSAAVGAAAVP